MNFSPDGSELIFSEGKVISVFDSQSGNLKYTIPTGKYTWSPVMNSNHVLGYVMNSGVHFWDCENNTHLTTVEPESKKTGEILFSHDGTRVYLVHSGGFISGWEIVYNE